MINILFKRQNLGLPAEMAGTWVLCIRSGWEKECVKI